MARLKKSQSYYDKAVVRLAAISSIDRKLDLGNAITADGFSLKLEDMRQRLDDYNTTLSLVDEKLTLVRKAEKELRDYSERILGGIGFKFGKDSLEYEKAGGVRKSTRLRNRIGRNEKKV